MQQRFKHRVASHLTAVPDDPAATLFHTSRIGTELAAEHREYEDFISMKRFDLYRIWRPQRLLWRLGMPKLSSYEADLIDVILFRGRPYVGHLTWTAMRAGQRAITISLAHEMGVRRPHASAAYTKLRKVGLVAPLQLGDREAVCITDHFHLMMFEAQWRNELRNSAVKLVDMLLGLKGWDWLLNTVDEAFSFSTPDYHSPEDRRRVLADVQRRLQN